MSLPPRLARELKTINAMVTIYCYHHHDFQKNVCTECADFLDYAKQRLTHCPFEEQKPTCGKCPIHCYKKNMQEKAKEIMRYSGPKMLWNHPIMAFHHLVDGRKKAPDINSCRRSKKNSSLEEEQKTK